jgi:predicted O-methyltransferase YrrM
MTQSEINALVSKWQHVIDATDFCFTWTEPHTLAYLAELASISQTIIECGTYMGRTALMMMTANPRLQLYCVDNFQVAGTFDCATYFLREFGNRVHFIVGDSAQAEPGLQTLKGNVDAVFVDDGHATEDVKRDIRVFLPLLRPGGVLCGHDFDVPHNDVAQGVIASLGDDYTIAVPRLWEHRKK